jgi:aryl-alcohol dehydrogenase-like predicted oxidoreductase
VQPEYNFGKRDIETELFPACDDQNVGIIPFQVFMGGLLTGTYDANAQPPGDSHMASRHAARAKNTYWNERNFAIVESLRSEAAELDISVPQLVLAWTLAKPQITSVIVGSSRPEQVASNAAAVEVNLPEQVLDRLDAL